MSKILFMLFILCLVLSASAQGSSLIDLEYGYQRPGGDYTSFKTSNAKECAKKCETSSRCKAFDYYQSDSSCWLKSKAYSARPYTGVVSGFKKSQDLENPLGPVSITMDISRDTQRPGSDYTWFQTQNAQQCAQKCIKSRKCLAFDYSTFDRYCYLKSWAPAKRRQKGIVTGLKKRFYPRVKAVQEVLARQNYNPGLADGLMGKNTRIALKNFQRDHYLSITGRIDNATLTVLGLRANTDQVSQGLLAGDKGPYTSPEKGVKENMSLDIETIAVTYLQLADDIYAKVLAKIPAHTPLQALEHRGDWYKVSFQNQVGFVLAESVKVNSIPQRQSSYEENSNPLVPMIPDEEFAQ